MTRAAAIIIAACCLVAAAPVLAAVRPSVSSRSIMTRLTTGHSVLLDGATISGELTLPTAAVVSASFVCTRCTFVDGIHAPQVRFAQGIDLSGATVRGDLDFAGAVFAQSAFFGSGASFRGDARFTFATFNDVADFTGTGFGARADFFATRFRSAARFEGPGLSGTHTFERDVVFDEAAFGGLADFRQRIFGGIASFAKADFARGADFTQAQFLKPAIFDDARFADDGVFLGATLASPDQQPAISFNHASIAGDLNLDSVVVTGSVQLGEVSARSISLDGTTFAPHSMLYANNLHTAALSLALDSVPLVWSKVDQETVLRLVESTARGRGNLRLANDAHYRLQVLNSGDESVVWHALDVLFYRGVAGYLVKPLRPLYWLIGIVLLAAGLRVAKRRRSPKGREPGPVRRLGRDYASALMRTTTRRKDEQETSILRLLELAVYAALVGCFLLALANTNPTLKQMVDALLKS